MFENEILWILLILVNFLIVNFIFYFWKKEGLIAWMCISIVIANIQVLKVTTMLGFVIALGNIAFSSVYLITDMLNEFYGKKEAKKAVYLGFFIMIAVTVIMYYTLQFIPHEYDFAQSSLETIFTVLPRITIASLTAFIISNMLNIYIFDKFKQKSRKKLWLRNNISTVTSEAIDNLIFTTIAFYGIFSFDIMAQIFLTSFVLRFVISTIDTPFLYMAKIINDKHNERKVRVRDNP